MWRIIFKYILCFRRRRITSIVGLSFLFFIYMYCFTQDSNHQVPGWNLYTSRDTRLYVNPEKNTLIISPKFLCTRPYLLIIVHSSVSNKEARSVVRNTWASRQNSYSKSLNASVKVVFILGKSKNNTLNTSILDENSVYGDIIQEDFIDTYNNLTIKSMMMLKWVIAKCPQAIFIMKADDNVYVNIPLLVKELKKLQTTGILMGHVHMNAPRITDPKNKWYAPDYLYLERIYPNYMAGAGYIMSSDVGIKLYEIALKTPILHLEDVYLTGICAKKANLSHINHPGFAWSHSYLSKYFIRLKNVILVHCDDLSEVNRIWNELKNYN